MPSWCSKEVQLPYSSHYIVMVVVVVAVIPVAVVVIVVVAEGIGVLIRLHECAGLH
jgi:hypothetical protein